MEEMKNEMIGTMEETFADGMGLETFENVCDAVSNETNSIFGKVMIGFVGAGITAAGAVAIAKRDKIKEWNEERMVRKLEKAGYDILRPSVPEEAKDANCEEEKI